MQYNTISSLFTGICDAIRKKEGSTGLISHQEIPERILTINVGQDGTGGILKLDTGITESENVYFDGLNEYGDIIPALTSGSTVSATVTESSMYSSIYAGYKALDGNNSTFWAHGTGRSTLSSGREMPCYIVIEFQRKISFDSYYIKGGNANEYPKSWELLGSDDGDSFYTIDTRNEDDALSDEAVHSYTLQEEACFKYVKLLITDSTNYCGVSSFNLRKEKA